MAPQVVHHVSLGSEALPTVLRAVEWPVIVVHAHMDRKIVSIIETLLAIRHRAEELCSRLVVCQMSFQVLTRPKFLSTAAIGALEDFWIALGLAERDSLGYSAVFATEALARSTLGAKIGGQSVFIESHCRLRLPVGGL